MVPLAQPALAVLASILTIEIWMDTGMTSRVPAGNHVYLHTTKHFELAVGRTMGGVLNIYTVGTYSTYLHSTSKLLRPWIPHPIADNGRDGTVLLLGQLSFLTLRIVKTSLQQPLDLHALPRATPPHFHFFRGYCILRGTPASTTPDSP